MRLQIYVVLPQNIPSNNCCVWDGIVMHKKSVLGICRNWQNSRVYDLVNVAVRGYTFSRVTIIKIENNRSKLNINPNGTSYHDVDATPKVPFQNILFCIHLSD